MTLLKFSAIMLTVLALLPGGAHLLELNNKIGMPEAQYYVVQGIYPGWELMGIVWAAALVANALPAYRIRREALPCRLAVAAAVLLTTASAVFLTFTFPANVVTQNWTVPPPQAMELRVIWEYSHAANAIIVFAALCYSTPATLLSYR
jgi:hypothetical protein